MSDWKIPFGNAKGELLTETDAANITWMMRSLQDKLNENPDKPYADKDRAWIVAAKAELARRNGGGTQLVKQQQPAAAPIQRAHPVSLGSSMNDPAAVTAHLTTLAASHHVVSPATTVDCLPPGCGLAVNYVLVSADDSKTGPGEVYGLTGGKVGLSGTTLAKIGAAAGVDWDASQSGRLDNGSDPHYCHFRAVGHVRNLDGSVRTLTGEVEIDAREGSPQIDEIRQKAIKRGQENASAVTEKTAGAAQILELRKFLLRHAESKAKNRAIASMGLRRSYTKGELAKPFAVCRLMWTGQTDDADLRRVFAEKTADAMIGGMASLYGKPAPQPAPAPHALPAPERVVSHASHPQFAGHAPPPVLARPAAELVEDFAELGDYGGDEEPVSEPKPAAATTAVAKAGKTKPNYADGEADL